MTLHFCSRPVLIKFRTAFLCHLQMRGSVKQSLLLTPICWRKTPTVWEAFVTTSYANLLTILMLAVFTNQCLKKKKSYSGSASANMVWTLIPSSFWTECHGSSGDVFIFLQNTVKHFLISCILAYNTYWLLLTFQVKGFKFLVH